MPLVVLAVVAAIGLLVLAFNELYTWMKGGDTVIGDFIGPWAEVGPKILAYLRPYFKESLRMWDELKMACINFINFLNDQFDGNKDKASVHAEALAKNIGKILWGLVVIVSNVLWTILSSVSDFVIEQGPGLIFKFVVFLKDTLNTTLYGMGMAAWNWITGLMDKLGDYLQVKIGGWLSQFTNLPAWMKKILGIVDTTIKVTNPLSEPVEGGGYSYYNNRKATEDRKIRKELTIKVDANLAVPPGTPEHQIASLRNTAKEVFDTRMNDLVTQFYNGTPEE
jgi:hypothetical protein